MPSILALIFVVVLPFPSLPLRSFPLSIPALAGSPAHHGESPTPRPEPADPTRPRVSAVA